MSTEYHLLSTSEVAGRKACTRMAVRNAIRRGDLRAVRIGRSWAVVDDDALAGWSVKETGGRAHKRGDTNDPQAQP